MKIRETKKEDWDSIWPIFHEIVKAGDTYAYDPNTSKEQGEKIWLDIPRKTFVFEENGKILATYYIKPIKLALVIMYVTVVTWCHLYREAVG